MFGSVKRGLWTHCTRGREVRTRSLLASARILPVDPNVGGTAFVYRVDSGYRSAMSVQSSLVMHPINEVRIAVLRARMRLIANE